MNTNPDDIKLALWLEDELEGEEHAAMEASCADKPELQAMREEHRAWKQWMARSVSSEAEPPYGEFFNARVLRTIGSGQGGVSAPSANSSGGFLWRSLFMPAAAAAGMVLAFQLGARTKPVPQVAEVDVSNAPRAIIVEPILYTPENGVKARWFNSHEADAFVILLDGVPAIPDAVDFSSGLSQSDEAEQDKAMADLEIPDNEDGGGDS